MLRKIIQLKELGLPLIDLNRSPEDIKETIISYILKADKVPLHVETNMLIRSYLLEQSIDKYLDIKDVLFLLQNTTGSYYTDEIIKNYFYDEKSAELIIGEYDANYDNFKYAEAHKGIVLHLYLKYKEISDKEFLMRLNVFYEKYQPIKLFGKVYDQTKSYLDKEEYPNIRKISGKDYQDISRIYHGAWCLLKAIFTFYNDKPECIKDFFSKPIEYTYSPWEESVRTKLDYSLDNITVILTGFRFIHSTFGLDEFLLRTFKILDSSKNSNE